MSATHPPILSIVSDSPLEAELLPRRTREPSRARPAVPPAADPPPAVRWSEVPVRVVMGLDENSKPCRIRLEFFDGDCTVLRFGSEPKGLGRRLLASFRRKIEETGHVHLW